MILWCCGAVVTNTAQLHLAKPELSFSGYSNLNHTMSDLSMITSANNPSPDGNKADSRLSVNYSTKTNHET